MYKFHNQNPLSLYTDDCTIRAISMAEGKTWDRTYDKLSDLAQEKGTLLNNRDFIIEYLDLRYRRVPVHGLTTGEVADLYKDHTVLITMPGHITVSIKGMVYDVFDCRSERAEYAWLVN